MVEILAGADASSASRPRGDSSRSPTARMWCFGPRARRRRPSSAQRAGVRGVRHRGAGICLERLRGLDVHGKTVMVLMDDPGYAAKDPKVFKGGAKTYYGRWEYKIEEAERQGRPACCCSRQRRRRLRLERGAQHLDRRPVGSGDGRRRQRPSRPSKAGSRRMRRAPCSARRDSTSRRRRRPPRMRGSRRFPRGCGSTPCCITAFGGSPLQMSSRCCPAAAAVASMSFIRPTGTIWATTRRSRGTTFSMGRLTMPPGPPAS